MLRVLLTLKPRDLYIAIKIMHKAVAGLCPAKLLADMPLDMPDVERQLRRLEKIGFLKMNGNGTDSTVILEKPLAKFSEHIKAFQEELDFSLTEIQTETPEKKNSKKEDISSVIQYYAKAKDEEVNFPQNVRVTIFLLNKLGTVERVCKAIDLVKKKMESAGLDWSLNGAVRNHFSSVLKKQETKGDRKWDW